MKSDSWAWWVLLVLSVVGCWCGSAGAVTLETVMGWASISYEGDTIYRNADGDYLPNSEKYICFGSATYGYWGTTREGTPGAKSLIAMWDNGSCGIYDMGHDQFDGLSYNTSYDWESGFMYTNGAGVPFYPSNSIVVYPSTNGEWQAVVSGGMTGVNANLMQLIVIVSNMSPGFVDGGGSTLTVLRELLEASGGGPNGSNAQVGLMSEMRRVADEQARTKEAVDAAKAGIADAVESNKTVLRNKMQEVHDDWVARHMIVETVASNDAAKGAATASVVTGPERSTIQSIDGNTFDTRNGVNAAAETLVQIREQLSAGLSVEGNVVATLDDTELTIRIEELAALTNGMMDFPSAPDGGDPGEYPLVNDETLRQSEVDTLETDIESEFDRQLSDAQAMSNDYFGSMGILEKSKDMERALMTNRVPLSDILDLTPDGDDVELARVLFRPGGTEVPVMVGFGSHKEQVNWINDLLVILVVYLWWCWCQHIYSIYTKTGGMT